MDAPSVSTRPLSVAPVAVAVAVDSADHQEEVAVDTVATTAVVVVMAAVAAMVATVEAKAASVVDARVVTREAVATSRVAVVVSLPCTFFLTHPLTLS